MMQDIKLLHSGCEFLTADQLGQKLFDEHEGRFRPGLKRLNLLTY